MPDKCEQVQIALLTCMSFWHPSPESDTLMNHGVVRICPVDKITRIHMEEARNGTLPTFVPCCLLEPQPHLTSKASWDTNISNMCQSLIENGLWINKTVELALFSSNFKHSPLLQADRYKGYSIQVSFAERTSKNNRIECQAVIQTYLRYPRHLSSSELTPSIPKIVEHLSRCFFTDAHFRCCWAQMVHVSRRKDRIFHHKNNGFYLNI